jgi:phosphatidylglycerophosphate synthase
MRKLPTEYENPFDNYILDITNEAAPYFHNMGFTPNSITTLSNITCILVVILLFQSKFYWAAFLLIVSYFFDCLDGHVARSYNSITVFGDYYDHISDVTKVVAVLISLYFINSTKFMHVLPVIIAVIVLMFAHLGCQELYYKSNESESLNFTKYLCPVPNNYTESQLIDTIKTTRLFGCGTTYATLAICIIYYAY